MTGSLIIGYDFSENEDDSVLVVAKKAPKEAVEIVNAFQGAKAVEIYTMLTTVKKDTVYV